MAATTIIQTLPIDANRKVHGITNEVTGKFLSMCEYYGEVSELPTDREMFAKNCRLYHHEEQNIYLNLSEDGATPNWLLVAGTSVPTLPALTEKGDLLTHNGIDTVILKITGKPNGYVLTVDSTAPDGIDWKPITAAPSTIVNTTTNSSGNTQVNTINSNVVSVGLNRLLKVQVEMQEDETITSITYNGVALTLAVSETDAINNIRNEQYYLVAPPLGTHVILINLSGISYITYGTEMINGADQTTPIGATQTAVGTSNAPHLDLTTNYNLSLVIDSLATAQTPIAYTPGIAQTENWSNVTATRQGGSSVESAGSIGDVISMDYALSVSTPWVYTAVEIKAVSAVFTGVQTVTGENVDNTDPQNPIVLPQVSVDSSDTTSKYLDDKIEIVSSDTSVTITKTIENPSGDEKISYDISVQGGGFNNTQDTPFLIGSAVFDRTFDILSISNGDVLFVVTNNNTQSQFNLIRLEKDSKTGVYFITHIVTNSSINPEGLFGFAVVGSFIYVFCRISAVDSCVRYATSNLAGPTTMTVTFSSPLDLHPTFSDGTNLYVYKTNNQYDRYTISGTTLTFSATITYTSLGNTIFAVVSNGVNVWFNTTGYSTVYDVIKYAIAGGSAVSTTIKYLPRYGYATTDINPSFLLDSSNGILGIAEQFNWTSPTTSKGSAIHIRAVTLP